LRRRLATTHGVRENDSLGLLHALGTDLPGAAEVLSSEDVSEDGHAGAPSPNTAGADVRKDPSLRTETLPNRLRFSLAGMQLKLSMAAHGQRLAVTSRSEDSRWIVKLPGRQYPELPAVEAATMAWARAAGHDVPRNFVVPVESLEGLPEGWVEDCPTAYAIERFDRRPDGTRVHHEDFCQVLDLLPAHKYGDTGDRRIGLDGLLRLVADAAGEPEARQFASRVGFIIACGNDDAHLKNWSFKWGSADRPALSPCYDLVATIAWARHGWAQQGGPRLGLALGRVRRFALLDQAALRRHGEKSGQGWARDAVMEGIARARVAWPSIADAAPGTMRAALLEHWRRVPVLRDSGALAV
jgi:serine/threonine-protein kinase HipA